LLEVSSRVIKSRCAVYIVAPSMLCLYVVHLRHMQSSNNNYFIIIMCSLTYMLVLLCLVTSGGILFMFLTLIELKNSLNA